MFLIFLEDHNLNPEVINWAKGWREKDEEYLRQRAQFAPEPTRSIAKLILALGQPGGVKKTSK
ncbi:MAG: hypothetical protein KKG76_08880 [Euryarchaeota archaeon]|nr:hypothetical protein [Euryarchaeota archaeon]MBU4138582.1 hypothetical protein [Euryarchaeota archaeon]